MTEEKVQSKGVVVVIIAAAFLLTFNQFLLITAFPTIMAEFDINATQVQWLTTAFILTTIIFIPMSGYLSTTYSSKTLVIIAISCLLAGTIIGGWSPNFGVLILSRVIQAIGAGIILPLIQTILLIVFPYHRRGFAMGLLGAVTNVAPASAPSISGIIIDYLDWRSLHWVLLPFILITFILAISFMKNVLEQQRTKLDIRSVMLSQQYQRIRVPRSDILYPIGYRHTGCTVLHTPAVQYCDAGAEPGAVPKQDLRPRNHTHIHQHDAAAFDRDDPADVRAECARDKRLPVGFPARAGDDHPLHHHVHFRQSV